MNRIQTDDIPEQEFNLEEHLFVINEKILILEKIIAESSTESEVCFYLFIDDEKVFSCEKGQKRNSSEKVISPSKFRYDEIIKICP